MSVRMTELQNKIENKDKLFWNKYVQTEEHIPGERLCPWGGQLIASVRTIFPLYVPSSGINPNQS